MLVRSALEIVVVASSLALIGCTPARFQSVTEERTVSDGIEFDTRLLEIEESLYEVFVRHVGYTIDKSKLEMEAAAIEAARERVLPYCLDGVDVVGVAKEWAELESFVVRIQCRRESTPLDDL
jgi:hypothetical protein